MTVAGHRAGRVVGRPRNPRVRGTEPATAVDVLTTPSPGTLLWTAPKESVQQSTVVIAVGLGETPAVPTGTLARVATGRSASAAHRTTT